MLNIKFSPKQAEALEHRLSAWDAIAECFADTDGLEHLAENVPARCRELCAQLETSGSVTVDETSELDRELMVEAIEGSTWVAVSEGFGRDPAKSQAAAYRTLCGCADKVSLAFNILVSDIDVPMA